ncbi:cell division protein FtsJ [Paenibacillus sp. HN-1]|uniref:cyclic-phosphate processing receiver domain-containing protein n=1 Tax=Paenibacillus TaxID=44249 RepID=UPI001CAA2C13|nr:MULTISPECIES: cyclic-phosphate processing receiver domain-containing protein [Paenibacillus]MBY9082047.1 cell division protein FtsJ [Paenibacillus sp. CGMCC 1.18879]MBY9085795.1 cell division protein FtsJ [Paenibacillus sinensis]
MLHIFMDDRRKAPEGFALARTVEECLLMLRECEVGILSLDYEMGPGEDTGGHAARMIVLEQLFPEEVYLHSSSVIGRKEMFETLYPACPAGTILVNGPIPHERLSRLEDNQPARGSSR